jgi:hypothetical protein
MAWQERQAASPGMRSSPAEVDAAAVAWQLSHVAPSRACLAWSKRIGIDCAG